MFIALAIGIVLFCLLWAILSRLPLPATGKSVAEAALALLFLLWLGSMFGVIPQL